MKKCLYRKEIIRMKRHFYIDPGKMIWEKLKREREKHGIVSAKI